MAENLSLNECLEVNKCVENIEKEIHKKVCETIRGLNYVFKYSEYGGMNDVNYFFLVNGKVINFHYMISIGQGKHLLDLSVNRNDKEWVIIKDVEEVKSSFLLDIISKKDVINICEIKDRIIDSADDKQKEQIKKYLEIIDSIILDNEINKSSSKKQMKI